MRPSPVEVLGVDRFYGQVDWCALRGMVEDSFQRLATEIAPQVRKTIS